MQILTAANWYWIVGGSTTQVYSSASNTYVPATDQAYLAWLSSGLTVSKVAVEADIWHYVNAIKPSWLFDGTTFAQPTPTTYTKSQMKAYSASVRYDKETGGTTINGAVVGTDRESQGMIERAYSMATKDSTFTTRWKGGDGNFGPPFDAPTIIAVGAAVGQHVAACFAAEATAADQITAGTIISLPQIDQVYAAIS